MTNAREFNARAQRIQALVQTLDQANDPQLHATAMELLQCVMDLHGAGLERILRTLDETPEGERAICKLAEDDLIASLLLLHNLHPDDIETRVHRALRRVHPTLELHGCEAELSSIEDGVVRIRLHKKAGGCGSTAATMSNALEEAVTELAPDAVRAEIEVVQQEPAAQLVSITQSQTNAGGIYERHTS